MEANAGEYIKNYLHLKRFPSISLHCKLAPVQYWEYEYGLLIESKISDNMFEWRFDYSFIIFKFIKKLSQILVSSLNTKNVCKNLVACN